MTASWTPPSRFSHLRVFAVGATAILALLLVLLFGVRMEAIAPATAIILPRDLHEARAPLPGLIEPGWHEGQFIVSGMAPIVPVRLDAAGNGMSDPAHGASMEFAHYQLRDQGKRGLGIIPREIVAFHRLQPGDLLWSGQVLAAIDSDEWRRELELLEQAIEPLSTEFPPSPARIRREELRRRVVAAVLRVPTSHPHWLVVDVPVAQRQAVLAGDVIATIAPCDPETRRPLALEASLQIDEAHLAGVETGQVVRVFSDVYNHRLHGHAEGTIERVDPWGTPKSEGRRCYRARAVLSPAPFDLPLGSSGRAEIVVGRKQVYRVILEH